ncbi:hypothetical protein BG842_05505 [Haladaptatus sp. W1]|uniref:hypothetical protein n=1 Tax=Haladaptatus sp. W1 TaxID=1897478 RepID=UPI000849A6F6|nr:hypothetical protein [Haladaptatus sp. W1]ODR79459.1 hypothetical protein BG842_05505 [Haladaptatus sp. W1]
MADGNSVPFWWIALFLLIALGLAYAGILYIGGSLSGAAGFIRVDSLLAAAPAVRTSYLTP